LGRQSINHVAYHDVGLRGIEQVGAGWLMLHRPGRVLIEVRLEANPGVRIEVGRQFPAKEAVHHVLDLVFGHVVLLNLILPTNRRRGSESGGNSICVAWTIVDRSHRHIHRYLDLTPSTPHTARQTASTCLRLKGSSIRSGLGWVKVRWLRSMGKSFVGVLVCRWKKGFGFIRWGEAFDISLADLGDHQGTDAITFGPHSVIHAFA